MCGGAACGGVAQLAGVLLSRASQAMGLRRAREDRNRTTVELQSHPVRPASSSRFDCVHAKASLNPHPLVADEVDPSLIITGPRRKRAAAAKAEQSTEWKGLLDSKLSALGDSESDSD